jgi:nitroimidazol reductase NimA-like FMN-containing flavoprotein (pyridoxamine 5'-phosphate oxidase superfamily)
MKAELRDQILRLLDTHRVMTIATNRPDGWPQATIVGYCNDGLTLYCFVGRLSQKFANIARDPRVSIAIADDFPDPLKIEGLSMAANAAPVEDKDEATRAARLLLERYPEYASWPMPDPALAPLMRFKPSVISVLDYTKGFGHSELVTVESGDVAAARTAPKHAWRATPKAA